MSSKYVAFLRGINVGGHHKVPMTALKEVLKQLGYTNIITLLNSGNVIFNAPSQHIDIIEKNIEVQLEHEFGFAVPTCVKEASYIIRFHESDPFKKVLVTKDIRLYISFLKKSIQSNITIPYNSPDNSYHIIEEREKAVLSVLDLSTSQTSKAMRFLDKIYGKNNTTRNWKTIERIVKKL